MTFVRGVCKEHLEKRGGSEYIRIEESMGVELKIVPKERCAECHPNEIPEHME